MLIDPPNQFSPRKEWKDFLNLTLRHLPQDDPDVQREVARAQQELARERC
jgi:hypothetical protein